MAVLQRGADPCAEVCDHRHVGGQPVHLILHLPEIILHLPDGIWEGKGAGEGKGDDRRRHSTQLDTWSSVLTHTGPNPSQKRLGSYVKVALMAGWDKGSSVLGHSSLGVGGIIMSVQQAFSEHPCVSLALGW